MKHAKTILVLSFLVLSGLFGGCSFPASPEIPDTSPLREGEEYRVRNITTRTGRNSISLSWNVPESEEIFTYHIYSGNGENGTYTLLHRQRETHFEHTGLAKGQSQWYKIIGAGERGEEYGGGLGKALPVRGAAFGAPPPPLLVTSDYIYHGKRYINLSWDAYDGAGYYAVDIYIEEEGETLIPLGGIRVGGSQIFRDRNILWDPGSTGKYRFILFGIHELQAPGTELDTHSPGHLNLLEEDISIPSGISAIGYISEIN